MGKNPSVELWPITTDKLITATLRTCYLKYQAFQLGDIKGVEVQGTRWKHMDPEYVAFAKQLLQLIPDLEEEEILNLVGNYSSER